MKDNAISIKEFRDNIADTLNRVHYAGDRILLERRGKKIAAIIPVETLEFLEELEDRIDNKLADKAIAEAKKEGFIDWEDLKKALRLE